MVLLKSQKIRHHKIIERKHVNLLPAFVVFASCIQLFSLLFVFGLNYRIKKLVNNPLVYVELEDGNTLQPGKLQSGERSAATIKTFVSRSMLEFFTWTGKVPQNLSEFADDPFDRGINLKTNGLSVTTTAWQSGFSLDEKIRSHFLAKVASMTPIEVFDPEKSTKSILNIVHISEPEKLKDYHWKISLISTLIVFENGSNIGDGIPLNFEIYVRSAPPRPNVSKDIALQHAVEYALKDGLMIYRIEQLEV